MRHQAFWFFMLLAGWSGAAQTTVSLDGFFTGPGQDIHDQSLSEAAVTFLNDYSREWGSWSGFAFSTVSNTTDGSFHNQYGAAQALANAYAVGYDDGWNPPPTIRFGLPAAPQSMRINNTTYAALAMRNGAPPARAFAADDVFVLTLTAYDLDGHALAATNHYLADFREGRSFIQTNWMELDLSWMPPEVIALTGTLETTDLGPWGPNTPMYFALADFTYSYGGLNSGIAATNPAILCWANGVADYSPGGNVSNSFQYPNQALGPAEMGDGVNGSTNVVSLGDGGSITLTFPLPITDAPGPDFAVFENAFQEDFLEFAYVEVSSDGAHFVRLPSHTLATEPVDAYARTNGTEATAIGGLAGKHLQGQGTLFDLRGLAGTPGLDIRRVTHVRLVDVVGDGSATDSYGNAIYDPHPTHGSGGFDLAAIGVLNPRLEITPSLDAQKPELPTFTTWLEYTAALTPTNDWIPVETRDRPGFYRWKLVR